MLKLFFLVPIILSVWTVSAEEDLYKLLGVTRKATVKEIKQAYRRKALLTHPDKVSKDIPPDEAAEAFRQVVQAFEVLSDPDTRRRYDRTGRSDGNNNNNNNNWNSGSNNNYANQNRRRSSSFQWNWHYGYGYRTIKLKDKFEVQQAQARVLHVVSLSQLQTIMLDDNELLERNLLISFVTPKTEQYVDDEMVYPYPFAAMSSQKIWWEDLLQTIRIKFYRSSELSRYFDISAEEASETPIFVFAKRGTKLTEQTAKNLPRILTKDREKFETWVWGQIEITIEFENKHPYPVEIYWIHGSKAHIKTTLKTNYTWSHTTMLSHEWYVRDARVDTRSDSPGRYKLTTDSSLGSWKIINDINPQRIIIHPQSCFDLSGHCTFWSYQGECKKNPNFMNGQCRLTCGLCERDATFHNDDAD